MPVRRRDAVARDYLLARNATVRIGATAYDLDAGGLHCSDRCPAGERLRPGFPARAAKSGSWRLPA